MESVRSASPATAQKYFFHQEEEVPRRRWITRYFTGNLKSIWLTRVFCAPPDTGQTNNSSNNNNGIKVRRHSGPVLCALLDGGETVKYLYGVRRKMRRITPEQSKRGQRMEKRTEGRKERRSVTFLFCTLYHAWPARKYGKYTNARPCLLFSSCGHLSLHISFVYAQ